MKTKLTLSIERNKVAKLRRASARKRTSISELVENLADAIDENPAEEHEPAISRYLGTLVLPPEAFEEDSREGAELRKTAFYARMKGNEKKRARA